MSQSHVTQRRLSLRSVITVVGITMLVAVGLTAASMVDWEETIVSLSGTTNTFDLQVAGSDDLSWTPQESSWKQGTESPEIVILANSLIGPGGETKALVAVRDASPRLNAVVRLGVVPPPEPNPLFDALRFTISEGSYVYADSAPASEVSSIPLTGDITSMNYRLLTVVVSLPSDAPNSLAGLTSPLQLRFTGENE